MKYLKQNNDKYIFEKSVDIKTNIEELFNFHLDTNNLPKISPFFPKASIEYISEVPLKINSRIVVKLSFVFFVQRWKISIKELKRPNLVSDYQEKGIFKYWYHSHIFENINDFVRMTDKVEFVPPFGILNKLLLPFIYFQLKLMFNYRHNKTKEIFEK